jgi:ribosomal protein S20
MKKSIFLLAMIASFGFLMLSCGGSSKAPPPADDNDFEEISDPFASLTDLANQIIEDGGVAAVGEGMSKRRDIAKEKARTAAQGKLAEIFNTKVQGVKKRFVEEVGSGDETEINEAFSSVTKTLTSQMLKGAVVKKTKLTKNKKTGQYMVGVVVAISAKTVNTSIMDEMNKNKPQLYQRFRASQAYKELKDEMKDYEEQQNN